MTSETTAPTRAYAARSQGETPHLWQYEPRDVRPDDIDIDVLYCGVCHTDIHFVDNDWGMTMYPVVPGHEIIGRVKAVGSAVTKFSVGDMVGVGCMVDSCRKCANCEEGLEQYCESGSTFTYNGIDRQNGRVTYGGYSERLQVSERFVVKVPDGLDPAAAAPILCAGITTYSPLNHVGVKPGDNVGVVGMGGLGHMGIKFAKAMGAEVTLFTRSDKKVEEGKRNGADRVVISSDEEQMKAAAGSLNYVLDTVPVEHDLNPYLACMKVDGTYLLVGQLTPLNPPLDAATLIMGRRAIMGSLIGGMPETQEVFDFCADKGITCDIEMLDIQNIGPAYERMKRGDVKYRFVIDMATLKAS